VRDEVPANERLVRERKVRVRKPAAARFLRAQIGGLLRRVDSLPTLDPSSEDEILGYDEDGCPR
jgi:hypothetical protein